MMRPFALLDLWRRLGSCLLSRLDFLFLLSRTLSLVTLRTDTDLVRPGPDPDFVISSSFYGSADLVVLYGLSMTQCFDELNKTYINLTSLSFLPSRSLWPYRRSATSDARCLTSCHVQQSISFGRITAESLNYFRKIMMFLNFG